MALLAAMHIQPLVAETCEYRVKKIEGQLNENKLLRISDIKMKLPIYTQLTLTLIENPCPSRVL